MQNIREIEGEDYIIAKYRLMASKKVDGYKKTRIFGGEISDIINSVTNEIECINRNIPNKKIPEMLMEKNRKVVTLLNRFNSITLEELYTINFKGGEIIEAITKKAHDRR